MPLIEYTPNKFRASGLRMIEQANKIVEEYDELGFRLTLRQLYYQFVSRDLVANQPGVYEKMSSVLSLARLAGLMDWDGLEDRTRWARTNDTDSGDPVTWLARVAGSYQKSRWDEQHEMVEVWIEKDALVGVIEPTCERLRVPFFPCRGFVSQSEMWAAAQRIDGYMDDGKNVTILYLGDHDPSGILMARDIRDRLTLFCEGDGYDAPIVERVALNIEQIQQYNPPPNPAKSKDPRFAAYAAEFGRESWELDALDPTLIATLIREEVESRLDRVAWQRSAAEEKSGLDRIRLVADNWRRVTEWLGASPT